MSLSNGCGGGNSLWNTVVLGSFRIVTFPHRYVKRRCSSGEDALENPNTTRYRISHVRVVKRIAVKCPNFQKCEFEVV